MSAASGLPVGVVLAGGQGRRLGGRKATATLGGRPLLSYPLRALADATGEVVVVAKPSTELPSLGAVALWEEPEEPSHPLAGVVEALRRAGGRSVLVCAGDMPFVSAEVLAEIIGAPAAGAPATVACTMGGALEPLLARYRPEALPALSAAAAGGAPAREAVAALRPLRVPIEAPHALFNVNTPEDLERAETLLSQPR